MNERAARLTAAANAKLSYYDWVRLRLRVAETESAIARTQAQLDNLKKLEAGGRVARADVLARMPFWRTQNFSCDVVVLKRLLLASDCTFK